jgi:hypothetical protein
VWLQLFSHKRRLIPIIAAILVACACIIGVIFADNAVPLLATAGILFEIAGLLQLELSGLFDLTLKRYADIEKYPGGPPSPVTRQLEKFGNSYSPIRRTVFRALLFNLKTGLYFILGGLFLQIVAVWL